MLNRADGSGRLNDQRLFACPVTVTGEREVTPLGGTCAFSESADVTRRVARRPRRMKIEWQSDTNQDARTVHADVKQCGSASSHEHKALRRSTNETGNRPVQDCPVG